MKIVKICLSLLLCITLCACSKTTVVTSGDSEEATKSDAKEKSTASDAKKVEEKDITVSFAGDITLGNYKGQGYSGTFVQKYDNNGYQYFLKNVKNIFDQDDLTFVNLEGPLTTETFRQEKKFPFGVDPKYGKILTYGGVDAVTLANNHAFDAGKAGYKETKKTLDKLGIGYCNHDLIYYHDFNGIKIAFLGFLGFSTPTNYKKYIKEAKKNADCVVTYFHWGIEHTNDPYDLQIKLAHGAIDAGSDIVIGAHPHVLQNTETYKGHKIYYSLGNFCFGGNKNPEDKDTCIVQVKFHFEDGKLKDYKDTVIPCSISGHTSYNDYQPCVVKGKRAKSVNKKLREL